MMSLVLSAEPPPLTVDSCGVVRVAGTRVTLDTVVAAFHDGATCEEMADQYPTLLLSDIYAAIGYYLRHKDEVDAYLKRRAGEARALQAKIESERPRTSRGELLARRLAKEKADAPTGQ